MKRTVALLLVLAMLLGVGAMGEEYHVADGNGENFGVLLIDLLHAYEKPSPDDGMAIEASLDRIRSVSDSDYQLAVAIADRWRRVYLDEGYPLRIYRGGNRAPELEQSALASGDGHAFVVLGYELKNGEMTTELKGRCDAAAAAAQSFPGAILVCSGGPTGRNNPLQHTEAGMMRDYLVAERGVDPARIFIDERAMSTVQNAVNTFEILRDRGIRTYTLVTSAYHQRWSQVVYSAMGEICRQNWGYTAEIVENYCYDIEPSERYRRDDIMAIRQLTSVLELPDEIIESMKKIY